MTELVLVGYWQSDRQPQLPHPKELVDPTWDPDERDLVTDYLRGGLPVVQMLGHSPCRMCSSASNGNAELTDGTYLWPEGLAHYVADHHVRLPREFVLHAVGRFEELESAALSARSRRFTEWMAMVE